VLFPNFILGEGGKRGACKGKMAYENDIFENETSF
jgi:hypothetical protein